MNIVDRFLNYVSIDTQSQEDAEVFPSTEKQKELADLLIKELKDFGAIEVSMGDNGNVYGRLPANYENSKAPSMGFSAHIDTSPDVSGKDIKAKIIRNYDGKDIMLNKDKNIILKVNDFESLKNYMGQDLIVTDGTTLLGADDKAGIAEIMNMVQYFYDNPKVRHGEIQIIFTTDEEVGCLGAKYFDKSKFNPDFAYTVDGGQLGEITYECFNAASAEVKINGVNIHPGAAKNKMKNSILIANEFLNMLPCSETPAHTENYEGYYHIMEFEGNVELTKLKFIIRDHDKNKFEVRKNRIKEISDFLNRIYGEGAIEYKVTDSYSNMGEVILPHFEIVKVIESAMKKVGVEPFYTPIRGGTDGAEFSFKDIPCPNICTGGHNYHSRFEYIPIQSMEKVSEVLIEIVKSFAK